MTFLLSRNQTKVEVGCDYLTRMINMSNLELIIAADDAHNLGLQVLCLKLFFRCVNEVKTNVKFP